MKIDNATLDANYEKKEWFEEEPDSRMYTYGGCYLMYGDNWYSPSDIKDMIEASWLRKLMAGMSDQCVNAYHDRVRGIHARLELVLKRNGKV